MPSNEGMKNFLFYIVCRCKSGAEGNTMPTEQRVEMDDLKK